MKTKRPTKTTTRTPAMYVEKVIGDYGIPQPSIRIDLGGGATYRQAHAAMHFVAARVELLSGKERWCVQTKAHDSYEHKGRVYLELGDGSDAECERGLALLRGIVECGTTALAPIATGV